MVNSLRKGKNFERKIAKLLSQYLGVEFKRVPMSGAFSTREGTKVNVFKGDIFTEDKEYGDIVIECKKTRHKIAIDDLLNKNSIIYQWIKQALTEAGDNEWWLIFQEDYAKPKILTVRDYPLKKIIVPAITCDSPLYRIYDLEEFLNYLKNGKR